MLSQIRMMLGSICSEGKNNKNYYKKAEFGSKYMPNKNTFVLAEKMLTSLEKLSSFLALLRKPFYCHDVPVCNVFLDVGGIARHLSQLCPL